MGYQERQKQEHRALAIMLYRYGMAFTPGTWSGEPPSVMEIFPLWSEEEERQMEIEKLRAKLQRWASVKISKPQGGATDG